MLTAPEQRSFGRSSWNGTTVSITTAARSPNSHCLTLRLRASHRSVTFLPGMSCTGEQLCGSTRSEEHTSELQSLTNLVCRLLLDKQKDQLDRERKKKLARRL